MSARKLQKTDTRKKRFIWIAGGIILALLIIFFTQSNNVATDNLMIDATGQRASVFIDRSRQQPLQSTSSVSAYSVSEGTHQVIVAHDGYWPWSDEVTVSSGTTTSISPFLIEQTGRRVLQTTSNVLQSLSTAQQQSTPTADSPITATTGDVAVFVVDNTSIIARWTGSSESAPDYFNCIEGECTATVYDQQPVQQIEFYPNRDDVLFFSTETGVYAIELDPTGSTQNFHPVVESVRNPVFSITNGNIFVQAGDRITVSDI